MHTLRDELEEKLRDLPEYRIGEILDFVEFIAWKETGNGQNSDQRGLEDDPILALAGTLSFAPLSSEEIDRELYGDYMVKEERNEE